MEFPGPGATHQVLFLNERPIKLPLSQPARKGKGLLEECDEIRPGDLFCTEACDVGGRLLAIDHAKAPGLKLCEKSD